MSIKIQMSFQKSITAGYANIYGVPDCVNFDNLPQAEMLPITTNPKDRTINVPQGIDKMYTRFTLLLNNDWKDVHSINGHIWYCKLIKKFIDTYCEKFGFTGLATRYSEAIGNLAAHLFNDLTQIKSVDVRISHRPPTPFGVPAAPVVVLHNNEIIEFIENGFNGKGWIDVELLVQTDNLDSVLKDTPCSYCENNDNSATPIFFNSNQLKGGICWSVINSFNNQKGIKMYLENLQECYESLKLDKLDRKEADFIIASFIKGGIFNFYADNAAMNEDFNLKHNYL